MKNPDLDKIKAYLENKMDSGQMHAFEKESLEDPFLMDALEGYIQSPNPKKDLIDLKKRLAEKIQKKKFNLTPFLSILRIAASIILISGIGFLFFRKKENLALKSDQRSRIQSNTLVPGEELKIEQNPRPRSNLIPLNSILKDSEISFSKRKALFRKIQLQEEYNKTEDLTESNPISKNDTLKTIPNPERKNDLSGALASIESKDIRVDKNNILTAKRVAQVSPSPSYALSAKIPGVSKSKDTELNEVVVLGYGSRKKTNTSESESLEDDINRNDNKADSNKREFEPIIGRFAYHQYLDSAGKNAPVNGFVLVEFQVSKVGNLGAFKIKSSSDSILNPLARKIILEGPIWKGGHKNYKIRTERINFKKEP